jgi:hypothetical protein
MGAAGWDRLGICRMSATFCCVKVSPPSVDFATQTPLCGSVEPNPPWNWRNAT